MQPGNRGGGTPILEQHYVLCSKLFDNIVSDTNHKLKAFLPLVHDSLLIIDSAILTCRSFVQAEQVILLYKCKVEIVQAVVLSHLSSYFIF